MEILGLTQTSHLWLFIVMVFGIMVMPGMDMAYVMASTLVGGRQSGFSAVAGIVIGGTLHVLMGVLGVGLLLNTIPEAFNLMLIAGSIYIVYIGWSLFRGSAALGEVNKSEPRSLQATFCGAFITCLLNPKAYLFMLAVFPQFLRKEYGSIAAQALVLGVIIAVFQVVIYSFITLGTARISRWLRVNKSAQVWLGKIIGLILIFAALLTGLQSWKF